MIEVIKLIAISRYSNKCAASSVANNADILANLDIPQKYLDLASLEYDKTSKYGAKYITILDEQYPELLKHIEDPPLCLIALGRIDVMQNTMIGIVGSRNASHNGMCIASKISSELASQGMSIVSGLAKGIDAQAHCGAISSTVAVIGSGISHRYPRENNKIYDQIIASGSCIITEFPIDTPPIPANFPRRNRIIAGMCSAVLVVEAGMQSGSLVTARLAREYNREVFAMPGYAFDEKYRGNNYLIKTSSARLCEGSKDILDDIRCSSIKTLQYTPAKTSHSHNISLEFDDINLNNATYTSLKEENHIPLAPKDAILNLLSSNYVLVDDIAIALKMSASEIKILLMEMEMDELIKSNGIGYCKKFAI